MHLRRLRNSASLDSVRLHLPMTYESVTSSFSLSLYCFHLFVVVDCFSYFQKRARERALHVLKHAYVISSTFFVSGKAGSTPCAVHTCTPVQISTYILTGIFLLGALPYSQNIYILIAS